MGNPKLRRSDRLKTLDPDPRLPWELIIDILSRLPSKTLCRFKSISKDFLFLISSDSKFKDLQRNQFLRKPRLLQYNVSISDRFKTKYKVSQTTFDLITGQECSKLDLTFSMSTKEHPTSIQVTCCRELVCIYNDRQIMVLNPNTHQFLSLGENHKNLPSSVGIGYIDSSKEYKVVQINRKRINPVLYDDLGFNIYTLKDGFNGYSVCTKIFEGISPNNFYDSVLLRQQPICVNGVLYWTGITLPNTKKMIVYHMNLKEISCEKIPFPKGIEVRKLFRDDYMVKLVELQGYFCIEYASLSIKGGCKIYALKDTKLGLWEQLYHIDFPQLISKWIPQVLGFIPSNDGDFGEPESVLSEFIDDGKSHVHIVANGTIKTTAVIGIKAGKTCPTLYYEGLFSLKRS